MLKNDISKGQIVIFKARDKHVRLDVKLTKETVWLTQKQIAQLFGTERPAITKHLNNIFASGELAKKSVCSILEHTAADGKSYKTNMYNLDAIVSVGYRVNSRRATQFRIWATNVLKNYLIKGYALNQKRLVSEQAKKLVELKEAIGFITSLLKQSGEKKFNDNALVAISLLIAASQPKEKDIMIKLITNLLKEE